MMKMSRLILLLKNQKIEIYKFYLNFFYFFSIKYEKKFSGFYSANRQLYV